MRLLKNNRRKNRLINDLRVKLRRAEWRFKCDMHKESEILERLNQVRKHNKELLEIKGSYYKLLAAIKINNKL